MVLTSRGGVGCCWVKSLLRLADYDVFPGAPKSLTSNRKVNFELATGVKADT
ncbi:MAG: hypothetical protein JWN92_1763 [Candidatus Acidoferrum typicum]|nr:hypothetical protein [Candidatus Acidoferrum typicum]